MFTNISTYLAKYFILSNALHEKHPPSISFENCFDKNINESQKDLK